jgi:hypothetical protein
MDCEHDGHEKRMRVFLKKKSGEPALPREEKQKSRRGEIVFHHVGLPININRRVHPRMGRRLPSADGPMALTQFRAGPGSTP